MTACTHTCNYKTSHFTAHSNIIKKIIFVLWQLSGEPNSSVSHKLVEQLQNEKAELENKLDQVRCTFISTLLYFKVHVQITEN